MSRQFFLKKRPLESAEQIQSNKQLREELNDRDLSLPETFTPKPGKKPLDEKVLGKLLRLVAQGDKMIENMIQRDRTLLLHAGTVTDLSGRGI